MHEKGAYEVKRLILTDLTPDLIASYAALASPENRRFLYESPKKDQAYFIIGATYQGEPVGLAIATLLVKAKLGSIQSIDVKREHQQGEVGRRLLEAAEIELKQHKALLATFIYPQDSAEAAFLEKLFKELQWNPPRPHMIRYYFESAKFRPAWYLKKYEYPPSIKCVFWGDLNSKEIEHLKYREGQFSFPRIISPFLSQATIEPLNSLVLKERDSEAIIGWMITNRLDENTIRYSSLYIEPEYRNKGYAIYMLIQALHRQTDDSEVPWAEFDLNLEQSDASWQRFIERRLESWGTKRLYNRVWKDFTKSDEGSDKGTKGTEGTKAT